METIRLSVIVPAYNEENIIAQNIALYYEYLKRQKYAFELIVVNDGSTDKTAEKLSEIKKSLPAITVINLENNRGKGFAVKTGLLAGKGEYRCFLDADNATPISSLEKIWPHFTVGAGIVIASRSRLDAPETSQAVPQIFWKKALGKAGNLVFQLLAVRGIWDTQCGFKAFRADFVERVIPGSKIDRWAFDAELLALARKYGYPIAIIPIEWRELKSKSNVGFRGYLVSLREVLKIRWNFITKKY